MSEQSHNGEAVKINKGQFFLVALIVVALGVWLPFFGKGSGTFSKLKGERFPISKALVSSTVGSAVKLNAYPTHLDIPVDDHNFSAEVRYSFMDSAQAHIQKLFETYRPDYGAFVAVDAQTGRVLSMVSYTRGDPYLGNLALRAIFPSASVFKVVTATAAIDGHDLKPDTVIPFNGRPHTLYRRNVEQTEFNRWTRYMTIKEAFGKSVNTVFGKLGIFYIGPHSLREYAQRFKFNNSVPADIPVETAHTVIPIDDTFGIAEAASGFTLDSKMSPMQGALIAAAIANDGVMMEPYVIDSIHDEKNGKLIYQHDSGPISVTMSPESAEELRILMRETVERGTSRKSFRHILRQKRFADVEFGGKTGSLTGTDPKGKCDWFVGYARTPQGHRIALGALTINETVWRVKSSQLAVSYFEKVIRDLQEGARTMASDHHMGGHVEDPSKDDADAAGFPEMDSDDDPASADAGS